MKAENPLVSFIVIAYQQEAFIREALHGAFAQTYCPLEIIVSDDASTDRTFEIIQEVVSDYQGPHKIILNKNKSNLGLGSHINKCCSLATGEWIVMAAGDDVSFPHRTEILMDVVNKTPNLGGIWSSFEKIEEDGTRSQSEDLPLEELLISPDNVREHLAKRPRYIPGHAAGCTAAWHRSVFALNGGMPDSCWCEDLFFSVRCVAIGRSLTRIPQRLVKYRVHESNISSFKRNGPDFIRKNLDLLKKASLTFQLLNEDLEQIRIAETGCLSTGVKELLQKTVIMLKNRLELDHKILSNGAIPWSALIDLWRLRQYYSARHLFFIIVKRLTPRIIHPDRVCS
jgi:glycosyltransferase involved in cell wall biosynthesis